MKTSLNKLYNYDELSRQFKEQEDFLKFQMHKISAQLEIHANEFDKYKFAIRELANRSPNPTTTDKLHKIFNIESNDKLHNMEESIKQSSMTRLSNIKKIEVFSKLSKSQEKTTAGKIKLFMNSDMADNFDDIINPKSTGTNRKQFNLKSKRSNERLGNSLMVSRLHENYSSARDGASTTSDHKKSNDYKITVPEF